MKGNRTEQKRRSNERKRQYLRDYKLQNPCARCGERDPDKLTFHHIERGMVQNRGNGSGISGNIARKTMTQILEELSKCIVLCRVCHDKEHARQRKCGKSRMG